MATHNPISFDKDAIHADPILYGMQRDGVPLTRENYIIRNWGEMPTDWNAEAEAELPEPFQDWDQFEKPPTK